MKSKIPSELINAFRTFETFILLGHMEPDGDALSSQLALGSFLKRRGKTVILVSPGPFDRPEIAYQEKLFLKHIPSGLSKISALIVILDCSTIDRISYLGKEVSEFTKAVIDHHSSGESFGDIRYIDATAPSVTFMIQQIIEAFKETPTLEEAGLLLFGLATDTGFFRHLENKSGSVLKAAGRLVEAGASPKDAHYQMYGNRTFKSRKLLGTLLTKAESVCNGRVIITRETKEEVSLFGKENRDSDMLYQLLFSITGVVVIVLLRYENDSEISVGLRSIDKIDVGAVAKSFGGGGHIKAAGFTWNGTFDEIEKHLTDFFCLNLET